LIVVSNSSPLITLGRSRRLEVLHQLFGTIHVASEVYNEVVVLGKGKPASEAVRAASWIEVHPAAPSAALEPLRQKCPLGAGDLATVVLAQALAADLAIIDERGARNFARERKVAVMGCVGILELGHRRGIVSDLRAAYGDLLRAGIRIDQGILNASLASCGLPPI
jgi:predicted nucleic acid-binding protein